MKFLAALIVFAVCQSALAWQNSYDRPLQFTCPQNEHLSKLMSEHSNHHEDRQWDFACRKGFVGTDCSWSDYVNNWDGILNYQCPNNGLVTGLDSYHDNHREDRKWRIRCCKLNTKNGYSCSETGYINSMDGWMNYEMERGTAITGLYSYHSNHNEDRRWKVKYCRYSVCKAQKMNILSTVNPTSDRMRIVGIVAGQGCSGATYTLSLGATDSVTETYSISDTHGKSFTFNTEISVTAEASAKFLGSGGSISVGVSQSFGGSVDYSKTVTKETSTGYSSTSGKSIGYTGPGAALIIGIVQEFKFRNSNLDVEYDIRCEDGTTYKERSKVTLTADTYGQSTYYNRHATFYSSAYCTSVTEQCLQYLRGEKALQPSQVIADFNNCLVGKARVYKK